MEQRGSMVLLARGRMRQVLVGLLASASLVGLSACSGLTNGSSGGGASDASPASSDESAAPVEVSVNVPKGADDVAVDTRVAVHAKGGTLDQVRVTYGKKGDRSRLDGQTSENDRQWRADGLLEPGQTYRVRVKAHNADGEARTSVSRFTTDDLTLDEQTYPSVTPLNHETVGVGMPVIVNFDIPVTRHKAVERKLHVTSKPEVKGSWHWVSDTEVHYRPKNFWPAHTKVHVDVDINGMLVADGIYGQENRSIDFEVGRKVVSVMNVANHMLTVRIDGKVARTLPATSGKPGFQTRSGTKLIMQKFESKRMDASTIGIDEDSPEYYDLSNVRYAMRVTSSGEFIHAAPWSVGSQGSTNVSHGCVGLSTSNAEWFYNISHRGDPVKFINSPRKLETGNGWTDWNEPFKKYKKGSALH